MVVTPETSKKRKRLGKPGLDSRAGSIARGNVLLKNVQRENNSAHEGKRKARLNNNTG